MNNIIPASKQKPVNNQATLSLTKNSGKKSKIIIISTIIGALFLIILANYLLPRFFILLTRASRIPHYSLSNSYVFAAPILAQADGQQKIQVTVFLLDEKGIGIKDQPVNLLLRPLESTAASPQIKAVRPTTDSLGQAIFEITCRQPGKFQVVATVNGRQLIRTTRIIFRPSP